MKKTLLWKTLILLCLLLSVALMLHPQAVRVRYFHPTEERLAYYPFTSPLLWGYGNFLPLLTLAGTVFAAAATALGFPRRYGTPILLSLALLPFLSLFSWIIFSTDTPVGLGIAALHTAALLLFLRARRNS